MLPQQFSDTSSSTTGSNSHKSRFSISQAFLIGIAQASIYSLFAFLADGYNYLPPPFTMQYFFNLSTLTYPFYFIICIIISFWMYRSSSFNKQLIKVVSIISILEVVACFIPLYLNTLGLVFLPAYMYLLVLLAISAILYNIVSLFPANGKSIFGATLTIVFLIALCLTAYGNYNDLSVKYKITYLNNAMFDSIEGCSEYLSPMRANECRGVFIDRQNEYNQLKEQLLLKQISEDKNLVINQDTSSTSMNYKYFPKENIVDMSLGTGDVANYGDVATVDILGADYNGKTYKDQLFPNVKVWLTVPTTSYLALGYEDYKLGVIGMKVGGLRKITFKPHEGFYLTHTDVVKANTTLIYTVELVALETPKDGVNPVLNGQSPGFNTVE